MSKIRRPYCRRAVSVTISDAMLKLIADHQPEAVAIEGLVYVQNTRIAFTLGQVRGVDYRRRRETRSADLRIRSPQSEAIRHRPRRRR